MAKFLVSSLACYKAGSVVVQLFPLVHSKNVRDRLLSAKLTTFKPTYFFNTMEQTDYPLQL